MMETSQDSIAIIGLAGRFPGAQSARALWEEVCKGGEAIRRMSNDELEDSVDADTRSASHYVPARALLDDVDQFDADLFRFLPREAELTDPQQRVLLEQAWAAMEDAGYAPRHYRQRVGVFAGCSINTYLLAYLANDAKFAREFVESYQVGAFSALVGNGQDFLATRISYKLNLRGPAMTVQSACSTSLLAIAQACGALRAGQTDLAIAGGVSISFPQKRGYLYQPGGMVSPDGHCRPFDADASGTVFGAGAGAVVLKRASEAIKDGDYIYALICGVGISNDGSEKVGYAAPSAEGQAAAIQMAHHDANISAETIGYVECHGTGTPLGDPIEVEALDRVFRAATDRKQFCTLGSIKGNIGHLDSAAGVTGLIKAVFALDREALPGTKHFRSPNPRLKLEAGPFRISSETQPWPRSEEPRRAGVSAFGVGGTNVHLVLQEAPIRLTEPSHRTSQLLVLSALNEKAVNESVSRIRTALEEQPEVSLADVAFTLATGREVFPFRATIVAKDTKAFLANASKISVTKQGSGVEPARVAFLFPGQGSQYSGMGAGLYQSEPKYRKAVDLCDELLLPELGLHIRDLLLGDREEIPIEDRLRPTRFAQPALFVTSYAAACMWISWGIKPAAMLGHSLGELVAACLAGVMRLENALTAVAARGAMMDALPTGSMLAVHASLTQLEQYLKENPQIDVAAENAPTSVVLSGPSEHIALLRDRLHKENIAVQELKTSHAFHSSMVDSVVPALENIFAGFELRAPEIQIASTVTGEWLTREQAMSPAYWARHCREKVQFSQALSCLLTAEPAALLESGAGNTLANLARRQAPKGILVCSTLPSSQEKITDSERTQTSLGELWKIGASVDWQSFYGAETRCRVPLPSYAFQRQRFWPQPVATIPQDVTEQAIKKSESLIEAPMPTISDKSAMDIANTRLPKLTHDVMQMLQSLSGLQLAEGEEDTSFLELGLDSLFLTQLATELQKKHGVAISFRQLLNELSSPQMIAVYLDSKLPPEKMAAPDPVVISTATPMHSTAAVAPFATHSSGSVAQLMQQQIGAMSELFRQQMHALGGMPEQNAIATAPLPQPTAITIPAPIATPIEAIVELKTSPRVKQAQAAASSAALTSEQSQFVDDLIARYSKRTLGSKNYTQQHRAVFADPRAVNGFRKEWKEMTYGLVVERAKGAYLWDIDGNEYVDLVNGFGPTMFGHGPQFVIDAVKEQIDLCFAVGPQSPLAGDTAKLIAEITHNERVTFCNTGSEAVMAAMRLARTVTGRDKVVFFAGDYHGQFDEVLVRGIRRNGQPVSLPGAPGIPADSVGNIVVLEYGEDVALDYLREHADELAAVIVEPVQSRHPGLQPRAFLEEARRITEDSGTALIFDEVVTGFRVRAGGAQEYFGIRADMATYGKVAGGGMPIGILAGKARFMDALDGGQWQFGDASLPEVGMTFFAGTFVRHPLVLAATYATLLHIRGEGDQLYRTLNRTAEEFAEKANSMFAELGVPFTLEHCGSILYLAIAPEIRNTGLLFALLRERGIYAMEHFPIYITTAHTEQDITQVMVALRESILDLQSVGFLPKNTEADRTDLHFAPLTEPQMEILLAAQMGDEENCAFNESCTLHLEGPLDETVFQASWQALIHRHDALRLILASVAGTQKLNSSIDLPIEKTDLGGFDKAEAEAEIARHLKIDAATPFDLYQGPLVRAQLIRLPSDAYDFIFTAHHIICDGWSINILISELAALYSAAKDGTKPNLAKPVSFREYARSAGKSNEVARQNAKDYWTDMFRELPTPLELPKNRTTLGERTFTGDTLLLEWPADFTARLRKGGGTMGCTLFVTLLGVWQMLLMRLAGQREAVVVIPSAAQSQLDENNLVGHCVHLLPIRGEVAAGQTAVNFLGALKQQVLNAYEHQEFTFGSLVHLLKVPREVGRLPLSEIQFNLEKQSANMEFSGLRSSWHANAKSSVNFDIFLNIVDTPSGLRLECDFNSTLYSRSVIERWLSCYREMLEGVLLDQQAKIDELPLLNGAEQVRQLSLNNPTGPRSTPADTLIDQLRKQVATTPEAIAVEYYGQKLSYAELFERSTQLAKRLVMRKLGKGDLIGIYLDRSVEMVTAMIGILQSGAAYVPLDPVYPKERIASICEDTSMRLLLTSEENAATIEGAAPELLIVDEDEDIDEGIELPLLTPHDAAYVIFTSGSTGKPKGVQITHSNLINALEGVAQVIGLDTTARLLAVTTLSFDIAALELLMPLICGATVVIAQRDDVADGFRLSTLLRASRATIMQATPITWRMLVAADMPAMPHLTMLCGGEGWDRTLANFLLSRGGTLWNMYGPTETTIWSAFQRVLDDGRPIGIEESLPNQRLYILDANQQLVPDGVAGELYIAGEGVGLGYYHRPELTASHFVDDIFSARLGSRMYRTGDKVRRREDGTIEFSGRFDDQIKLRGFRIEPGEIESALRALPGIDQAFVVLRSDRSGTSRLVAYTTHDAGLPTDTGALLETLSTTLPEYMIPAMIVPMAELPLTGNNKVDRKRLPEPDFAAAVEEVAFVEPKTLKEKQLVDIWCQVLALDRVSIDQPLLSLGADSLHIFQIAARAQQAGLSVTARQLMKLKTVEAICAAIIDTQTSATQATVTTVTPIGIKRASRDQYRLVPTEQMEHCERA